MTIAPRAEKQSSRFPGRKKGTAAESPVDPGRPPHRAPQPASALEDPTDHLVLRSEGGTTLWLPEDSAERGPARRRAIFYNAAMAIDRDLGVAVVEALHPPGAPGWNGWEMTAATGVRGLRLLAETGAFRQMLLTETHPIGFTVLSRNSERYSPQGATARRSDARTSPTEVPFDYVDLDPYGSPQPFLPVAVRALIDGGILAVTATDLRVLAGVEPGAAERRYGGHPIRGRLGPEGGLRLLLAHVALVADAAGRSIETLLAYVRDHHVRAYLRVRNGRTAAPVAPIDPASWAGPPLPPGPTYGPLWLGRLFDSALIGRLSVPPTSAHRESLARLLDRFRSEAPADTPFYYEPNEIARFSHFRTPPALDRLIEEIRRRGWPAGRTHAREGAFRTPAPRELVVTAARGLVEV